MSKTTRSTRRRFLTTTAGAAAAIGAARFTQPSYAAPIGANDDIRLAVIGFNSRGGGHIKDFHKKKGVRIAGLCDADQNVIDKWVGTLKKDDCNPRTYTDYRKLCEDPEIDAVVIATPNHLHTVIAMTAIANGKHVYVEKPVSHNVWEGRKLVDAAAAHPELIVQHGMQRRSDGGWRATHEWLKDEPLGKILCSRGLCYKPRKSIGKVSAAKAPPSSVDYDLWCGPREMDPIMRERFHYDWHWQFAYGNGDLGNQGPHQTDVAAWMLDNAGIPNRVISVGGRFGYEDDGNTANTQICLYEYDDGTPPIIFEVRGLPAKDLAWNQPSAYVHEAGGKKFGTRIGNVVHCEGGFIVEKTAYDNDGNTIKKFGGDNGGGHTQQFLDSIRAGKAVNDSLLVKHGHSAASLAHLGNISYQLGKTDAPEAIQDRFGGSDLADETVARLFEHMGANGIDPAKTNPTLGPALTVDPKAEKFIGEGAEAANPLLTGTYRDGHKLPAIG